MRKTTTRNGLIRMGYDRMSNDGVADKIAQ